jgi:Uma2 family endonuclease
VLHYWIVDPADRTAEAFKLVQGKYTPAGKGHEADVVRFPPFNTLDIQLGRLWHPPVR